MWSFLIPPSKHISFIYLNGRLSYLLHSSYSSHLIHSRHLHIWSPQRKPITRRVNLIDKFHFSWKVMRKGNNTTFLQPQHINSYSRASIHEIKVLWVWIYGMVHKCTCQGGLWEHALRNSPQCNFWIPTLTVWYFWAAFGNGTFYKALLGKSVVHQNLRNTGLEHEYKQVLDIFKWNSL